MKKIGFTSLLMLIIFQSFGIDGILIQTLDYSLKEKWNHIISSNAPSICSCYKVFKKQYFFVTAVAADYASDKNDSSNVEYSIKITKPDNSTYFTQEHLPLLKGKAAIKSNVQMSDAILKVCFENVDFPGKYDIELRIDDIISGKSKTIKSDITLVDLPACDDYIVKDDQDFSKWFAEYYEKPSPEKALAYYIYYSKSKLSEKETSFWPTFSIFLEIMKNNKYLTPQILDCYKSQDLKTKIYLLYLMTYANIGTDDFFNSLEGDEKASYTKIKNNKMLDIYGPVSNASQLDMLWGTFLGSGSYQPILKLIQTLDYSSFKEDFERFKESKQNEDRKKAMNYVIYNSLVWSLKSNCRQHKLVKAYCTWALQNENLSNVQKEELGKIIE